MPSIRILLVLLAAHTAGAGAADDSGQFALKGAGLLPCEVYAAERDKRSTTYYLIGGWVEGYVSGYNRFAADTYDITSYESLELLLNIMQQHCQKRPKDRLYPLVNSILADLHAKRIKSQVDSVEIKLGKRKTYLYRETIRRMQGELADRKLYQGSIDGRFSAETSKALAAFQTDIKFTATGFPDQATLWRLLRR